MRILMLGGTSFLGPAVARELLGQGHSVAVFHRGNTERTVPEGVTHIHGAREQLADFKTEFASFAPDVVINMILMTERQAQNFVSVFSGLVPRAVVISSQDVYRAYGRVNRTESGPPDPVPLTEDAPLRDKLYPYRGETPRADGDPRKFFDDYDKILVERVVMSADNLPATVLRLPAVYGPGDQQHRAWNIVKRALDGRRVLVFDEREAFWRWTHGYVDDVAHAIALAATDERAAGRIYNVGEPEALTVLERSRLLAQAMGWNGALVTLPAGALPQEIAPDQDLVVASDRIRAELGYTETLPRAETLARTVAWERDNPPAESDPAIFDYATEDALLANHLNGDSK